MVARSYMAGYRDVIHEQNGDDIIDEQVFAPIAGLGWNPADPVQFVVHETIHKTIRIDSDRKAESPSDFGGMGPVEFVGKIDKTLPVFITRKFAAKGLKIAPSCRVVNLTEPPSAYRANDTATWVGVGGLAS
jgi:hypothetical protein